MLPFLPTFLRSQPCTGPGRERPGGGDLLLDSHIEDRPSLYASSPDFPVELPSSDSDHHLGFEPNSIIDRYTGCEMLLIPQHTDNSIRSHGPETLDRQMNGY